MLGVKSILLFLVSVWFAEGKECAMSNKECEFYLTVHFKLTMRNGLDLVYPAHGRLYKYDVTNTSLVDPVPGEHVVTMDGSESKQVVTVNGSIPGPAIVVYEGQMVTVHVRNNLYSDTATIHWHGLTQKGTPWMDGTPFITQCPILPGQTFTYRFKANPKGTHYYHSHIGQQRLFGVYGAFIVKERKSSSIEEHNMLLQEFNHDTADATIEMASEMIYEGRQPYPLGILSDGSVFTATKMLSILVNGKGRVANNEAPLEVFEVRRGASYRFRVTHAGAAYAMSVSVDGHALTVVASDGFNIEPVNVDWFVIIPGERFDFILETNQDINNYWIRVETMEVNKEHIGGAILRYMGASEYEPTTPRKVCTSSNRCLALDSHVSVYPSDKYTNIKTFNDLKANTTDNQAPQMQHNISTEHFINLPYMFAANGVFGTLNGRSFHQPEVNLMAQSDEWSSPCEAECGLSKPCFCTNSITVQSGDTAQVVLTNMGKGATMGPFRGPGHPMHLHGHSFYVLKVGYGKLNESTNIGDNDDIDCRGEAFCNNPRWNSQKLVEDAIPGLELERPPRKDTIYVPNGGYVVIRFVGDNPGLWDFHCHLKVHNALGMRAVVNSSWSDIPPPPEDFPTCHSWPRLKSVGSQPLSRDDSISQKTFWIMFGVLLGVIIILVLVIVGVCAHSYNRKPIKSLRHQGAVNEAYERQRKLEGKKVFYA